MKVAVFGLGYVGTVSAACLADNGHDVWGVDPDELKVAAISAGQSPVLEPGLEALVTQGVAAGTLHATVSPLDALEKADVSLLCVGTPSSPSGESNLSYIYRAVEDIIQGLTESAEAPDFHTVVIRSTVPPGTVEDLAAILKDAFCRFGSRRRCRHVSRVSQRGHRDRRFLRSSLYGDRRLGRACDQHDLTPLLVP